MHDVERLKADLRAKGLAVATVNRCLSAAENRLLQNCRVGHRGSQPGEEGRLFKENNQRTRFLSEDEMSRLLFACEDSANRYLAPIVAVALNTGMRKMEILHLR